MEGTSNMNVEANDVVEDNFDEDYEHIDDVDYEENDGNDEIEVDSVSSCEEGIDQDDEGQACNDLEFIASAVVEPIDDEDNDNDDDDNEGEESSAMAGQSRGVNVEGSEEIVDYELSNDEGDEIVTNDHKDHQMTEGSSNESSSDDDEEDEDISPNKSRKQTNGALDSSIWCTEEEEEAVAGGPPRTKNELDDNVIYSTESITVNPNAEPLTCVGHIQSFLPAEGTIVVEAAYTTNPLVEGSALCFDDGFVLGCIHEIFGPVCTPYYIVRIDPKTARQMQLSSTTDSAQDSKPDSNADSNLEVTHQCSKETSEQEITNHITSNVSDATEDVAASSAHSTVTAFQAPVETRSQGLISGLAIGRSVFTVPSHAQFITPATLQQLRVKGSDASNVFDEEVGPEEEEFSDDEAEMAARQARNQAKKAQQKASRPSDSPSNKSVLGKRNARQGQISSSQTPLTASEVLARRSTTARSQQSMSFVGGAISAPRSFGGRRAVPPAPTLLAPSLGAPPVSQLHVPPFGFPQPFPQQMGRYLPAAPHAPYHTLPMMPPAIGGYSGGASHAAKYPAPGVGGQAPSLQPACGYPTFHQPSAVPDHLQQPQWKAHQAPALPWQGFQAPLAMPGPPGPALQPHNAFYPAHPYQHAPMNAPIQPGLASQLHQAPGLALGSEPQQPQHPTYQYKPLAFGNRGRGNRR